MKFLIEDPTGVLLILHVLPNAPKSQIIGLHGEVLKIKIQAPPVDGKANQEIQNFLSRFFEIAKNRVVIVGGETARAKRVRREGLSKAQVLGKLKTYL